MIPANLAPARTIASAMWGPITQRDYYELNPPPGNTPGDIWHDVPTFGLLPFRLCTGIVITPACDLANRKAETITYLPVVPIIDWFKGVAFLPELRRIVDGQWKVVTADTLLVWPDGYRLPEMRTVLAAQDIVRERLAAPHVPVKERAALVRITQGLGIIDCALSGKTDSVSAKMLAGCVGPGKFRDILEGIATNSYRPDLHFLPADRQAKEWSGVPVHSVVLFRYPLTVPVELFDAAQDISLGDWLAFVKLCEKVYPIADAFSEKCPTKRIRVKAPFVSDLIARYIGLNVRLGSPNFTTETVTAFVDEISDEKDFI